MLKEFEMTEAQLDKLLEACKPTPYLVVGGMAPRAPQENANDAWIALGKEMGFDGKTVTPVSCGKGFRFFLAEPT